MENPNFTEQPANKTSVCSLFSIYLLFVLIAWDCSNRLLTNLIKSSTDHKLLKNPADYPESGDTVAIVVHDQLSSEVVEEEEEEEVRIIFYDLHLNLLYLSGGI